MRSTFLWSTVAFLVSVPFLLADAPIEIVTVLVARDDIPQWTTIREPEKLFKKVRYVKGDEPKDAITDFVALKDKRLKRSLAADQPVKAKDLLTAAPIEVPKGTKAISLRVTTNNEFFFIVPGARVNVTHTLNDKTQVIAEDVLVLAVDLTKDEGTVTLAVKPDMTTKLTTAAKGKGKLSIAMPPPKDK